MKHMNELQIFESEEFGKVRTVVINNEPWMVGKDVAEALGYTDINHTIVDHVDEEDRVNSKTQGQIDPEFGQRGTWLINESGLYALVLSSKLPTAKQFKRWVTAEVLPSIRKTGKYAVSQDSYMIADPVERAKKWIEEETVREQQAVQLEAQRPKVLFADSVSVSRTAILIGELAKIIKQNGVDMGQNRLFTWMRDHKYLISRKGTDYNMPTQKAMKLGLFVIKETTVNHSDGHTSVSKTPKVTGKGQIYFINKFLNEADEAVGA